MARPIVEPVDPFDVEAYAVVGRLVRSFYEAFPWYVQVWSRYPDLDGEEDELTDRVACRQMSELFRAHCEAVGIVGSPRAVLVHGTDAPWVSDHWWVRIGDVGIDWTARQFHNLEHPPSPAHADLPCPFVWRDSMTFKHPLVDFTTITVTR